MSWSCWLVPGIDIFLGAGSWNMRPVATVYVPHLPCGCLLCRMCWLEMQNMFIKVMNGTEILRCFIRKSSSEWKKERLCGEALGLFTQSKIVTLIMAYIMMMEFGSPIFTVSIKWSIPYSPKICDTMVHFATYVNVEISFSEAIKGAQFPHPTHFPPPFLYFPCFSTTVPKMTPFRILLSILLGVVSLSHGASTTWDASPSRPTTPGVVSNCNKWYTVQKGDTCFSVTTAFRISMDDFLRWNPSVSADCLVNFWADTSYCVGVGPVESTTTKANGPRPTTTISTTITTTSDESTTKASGPRPTTTITTTITTTPISTTDTTDSSYTFINPITSWNVTTTPVETAWPPTRTQDGQAKNCNRWHRVRAGETCESIHAQYDSWMTFEDL